ncbi:helix-turn-helix domain-containing protein [Actinokineospora auranticolor]|uniref:Helix-turn-helix protein n=1 Tax=Actinokineospora auranticolor TaxID=155976 RepID=A0A2S6GJ61_9PSEU|nr:helix-turn-helix domain-containing protein [Actinokineospora auranticolor]PPK65272.1 helix-turn-helix protein [Actinokineospora auranticolor]
MGIAVFGDLLRFHRLRAGLTQEELAERTGVSVRAICDMERGRARNPRLRTAELLASGLGLAGECESEFMGLARSSPRAVEPPEEVSSHTGLCALPPVVIEVTGRDRELGELRAQARLAEVGPGVRTVLVSGLPGVGKTALAVEAGHRLAHRFDGGCRFLDLRGVDADPLTPALALHRLLGAFGVEERAIPGDEEDRLALYRSLVRDRAHLLVLDNAAWEGQVRPLLEGGPGSMVLVTSRGTLAGLAARHRLSVEVLSTGPAVELLAVVAGAERVSAEPAAAARVAELCGGMPLALVIAGNRLTSRGRWTIEHLSEQLAGQRRRLSVLTAGDLRVRTAFELSYRHLPADVARVFRGLALVPGSETSVELAAVVSGLSPEVAESALEELADAGLIGTAEVPGRYTHHDLIQVFASEQLDQDEDPVVVARAAVRARAWLLRVAAKAAAWFDPDRDGDDTGPVDGPDPILDRDAAHEWLVDELPNWLGALRAARADGAHREVLESARAVYRYAESRGAGELRREVGQAGAEAARALGARPDRPWWEFAVPGGASSAGPVGVTG